MLDDKLLNTKAPYQAFSDWIFSFLFFFNLFLFLGMLCRCHACLKVTPLNTYITVRTSKDLAETASQV